MTVEYVDYIPRAPWTKWEWFFTIHTYKLHLEIWVELCSRYYAQKSLFIPVTFPKIIHSNTIIENTDIIQKKLLLSILTLFIIRTDVNFFLFSKFLSWK